jgi:hypothetical protein
VAWFTTALRANTNNLTHYLDDLKGLGTHLEEIAGKAFFVVLSKVAGVLRESKDKREVLRLIDALMWNFSAVNHRELLKMNLFRIFREGNGKNSNLIKKSWGHPLPSLVVKPVETTITEASFDAFEMLFTLVTGRISQGSFGDDLVINKSRGYAMTKLAKAKSAVDENVSEQLLGQAFEIIFAELDRYANLLDAFDGLDWEAFARQRNEDRRTAEDEDKFKPIWLTEVDELHDQCSDPLDPKEKAK